MTRPRLAKGTRVRYTAHHNGVGRTVFSREQDGTIVGYYGDLYVIEARHSRGGSRVLASNIHATLTEWTPPHPNSTLGRRAARNGGK